MACLAMVHTTQRAFATLLPSKQMQHSRVRKPPQARRRVCLRKLSRGTIIAANGLSRIVNRAGCGPITGSTGMEMGWIAWIIVGLIAGLLARFIVPGQEPGGLLITIILGIVGGIVGGFLGGLLGLGAGGFIWNIILATIGAIVLIVIYNAVRRRA
jgi:uncharacterized membrane protein YeaQ/YmgE (transglycosylase-associated protein family)